MTDLKAALTFLFTVTFIASPLLTDPFMGFSENQLPIPQINPPVQPAGYAFAIWGLIYAWLFLSATYGLALRVDDPDWERARTPLIISLLIGTPWLMVANQNAVAATVMIFAMAGFAILAVLRGPRHDRWLFQAPVAIYAGWLTAASFVSLGSTAAGYGLVFDQIGWAYAAVGAALLVALTVQNRVKTAPEYGATVIWALVGIIVANLAGVTGVAIAAGVGIVVIGLTLARNTARAPAV